MALSLLREDVCDPMADEPDKPVDPEELEGIDELVGLDEPVDPDELACEAAEGVGPVYVSDAVILAGDTGGRVA